MITSQIKTLDGKEMLEVMGETITDCLAKLLANASFFKIGQTYRRIRFDETKETDLTNA